MPTKPKPVPNDKPLDPAISDINRGVGADMTKTEDERRAQGTDASQQEGAGEHDRSERATAGQQPGGTVLDTYAGAASQHGNIAGESRPLVVGQAPDAPNTPQLGSANYGHRFHPSVPNPKNQSPMVRGPDAEPVKSYADLTAEAHAADAKAAEEPATEVEPVES